MNLLNRTKTICFFSILLFIQGNLFGQIISEPFEFQFEGKTLRGLIEKPQNQDSKAIIIIIPGYGKTNFVEGGWYAQHRNAFVSYGLTVCFWDKMGCGGSEGEFDAQQPVANSAEEAVVAIEALREMKITGYETIGLWGLSRAGWICPLINEQFPVNFWISVSGTDDKENFAYLLKSNLLIEGKEEQEAQRLYEAWMLGHKTFCTNGTYEEYQETIQPLKEDSTCQRLFGYQNETTFSEADRQKYLQDQQSYTSKGYFDGLWVYLDDFDKTLQKLKCPVLAIFGENDSQVDWRKTKKLYEETIGFNPNSKLITKVFPNCNHILKKCITCAYQEDLSALEWQACDNYYETMEEWLRFQKIIE